MAARTPSRLMFVFGLLLATICAWIATGTQANAQKRLALLIGNQSYTAEVGRLANPHNDVALLERTLKGLGFEVTTVRDAGLAALHQAVDAHVRRIKAAGPDAIAFTYYSGHGAADGQTNYLIPVDVKTAEDGELWDQSLRLNHITRQLKTEAGNATHFVVFDACRNELKLRKAGSRSLLQSKGFAAVAQESGMLIAYATAEGELASDVGQGAGPYAKVLAEEIVKPGVEAVYMFRRVQVRVRSAIGQEPWLGFNALREVHLAGAEAPRLPPKADPPQRDTRLSEATEAWDRTKDTTSIVVLEAFIVRFKDTFYADLARARIEELKKQQVAVAAPPKVEPPSAPANKGPGLLDQTLGLVLSPKGSCEGVEALVENGRRCLKPKDSFKDCAECPEMVVIPAGEFMMGSPKGEGGRENNEDPQHKVTITKPFAVGKFEATFVEWNACVAAGGCKHKPFDLGWGRGKRPVMDVSWADAKEYIAWLSNETGRTYRLLTEAEWEYAARAGTTTAFSTGRTITTGQANFDGSEYTYGGSPKGVNRDKTIEVGSLNKPNAFGLHDMHGNAWEWVEDCYQDTYAGAPSDGRASSDVALCSRVRRGGSFTSIQNLVRSAYRQWLEPDYRGSDQGFRVARTLD